jgi:hypothetical protein
VIVAGEKVPEIVTSTSALAAGVTSAVALASGVAPPLPEWESLGLVTAGRESQRYCNRRSHGTTSIVGLLTADLAVMLVPLGTGLTRSSFLRLGARMRTLSCGTVRRRGKNLSP